MAVPFDRLEFGPSSIRKILSKGTTVPFEGLEIYAEAQVVWWPTIHVGPHAAPTPKL